MKKVLVAIFLLIVLTGCFNKENTDYPELKDINYIKENKSKIESVIVRTLTIGSEECYQVDINKAYNAINNLKILKESNLSVTDDYMSYTFNYKDKTKTVLSFEGPYLLDSYKKSTSYTVDFNEVDLLKEDQIKCKNSN